MSYLEVLNFIICFTLLAILAITAGFIIGNFMAFMFELLSDKIKEFMQKAGKQ